MLLLDDFVVSKFVFSVASVAPEVEVMDLYRFREAYAVT